jgi:chemotaxis protein methyltransferase CheR
MDIVFLRNVAIYFSESGKRETLSRVKSALRPGGYLLLGASETAMNLDEGLQRTPIDKTTWYRREAAAL